MSNSKKLLITALAVILLVGAGPVFADLDGIWVGQGDGTWEPPSGVVPIHPWQEWEGLVENGAFDGSWWDSEGYYGNFHGDIIFLTPEVAHCEGYWTWMDICYDPPQEITVGPFEMDFYYLAGTCEGEWWVEDTSVPRGTMWGWSIGD